MKIETEKSPVDGELVLTASSHRSIIKSTGAVDARYDLKTKSVWILPKFGEWQALKNGAATT